MHGVENHYATLGLDRNASDAEVKAAFRALAKATHPDVAPGAASLERFKRINAAYTVLSGSASRAAYDASSGWGASASAAGRHRWGDDRGGHARWSAASSEQVAATDAAMRRAREARAAKAQYTRRPSPHPSDVGGSDHSTWMRMHYGDGFNSWKGEGGDEGSRRGTRFSPDESARFASEAAAASHKTETAAYRTFVAQHRAGVAAWEKRWPLVLVACLATGGVVYAAARALNHRHSH